jgi:hypothetical protein
MAERSVEGGAEDGNAVDTKRETKKRGSDYHPRHSPSLFLQAPSQGASSPPTAKTGESA